MTAGVWQPCDNCAVKSSELRTTPLEKSSTVASVQSRPYAECCCWITTADGPGTRELRQLVRGAPAHRVGGRKFCGRNPIADAPPRREVVCAQNRHANARCSRPTGTPAWRRPLHMTPLMCRALPGFALREGVIPIGVGRPFGGFYTAKPNVIRAAGHFPFAARADHIPRAGLVGPGNLAAGNGKLRDAQIRPRFLDLKRAARARKAERLVHYRIEAWGFGGGEMAGISASGLRRPRLGRRGREGLPGWSRAPTAPGNCICARDGAVVKIRTKAVVRTIRRMGW